MVVVALLLPLHPQQTFKIGKLETLQSSITVTNDYKPNLQFLQQTKQSIPIKLKPHQATERNFESMSELLKTSKIQKGDKQASRTMKPVEDPTVYDGSIGLAAELEETLDGDPALAPTEEATTDIAEERMSSPAKWAAVNTADHQATDSKDAHPTTGGKGPTAYNPSRHRTIVEDLDGDEESDDPDETDVDEAPHPPHRTTGGKGPMAYAHLLSPRSRLSLKGLEMDEDAENDEDEDVEDDEDGASSSDSESSKGSPSEGERKEDEEEVEDGNEGGDTASSKSNTRNGSPSSPQHEEPLTPTTGGDSPEPEQATEADSKEGPEPIKNLMTATVKEIKEHLESAGLNTTGIKDVVQVRLLLHWHGLDEATYSYRCSKLLDAKLTTPQYLKRRLEELHVHSKGTSKPNLIARVLLAERDNDITPDDEGNVPEMGNSAPVKDKNVAPKLAPTKKKPAPKPAAQNQASKRKHADSTAGSDDEDTPAKRRKSQKAARTDVETATNDQSGDPAPQPAPNRPKKSLKRKHAEDETASSAKKGTHTKRPKHHGSAPSAIDGDDTATTSPLPNTPKEKPAKPQVDMTQPFEGQFDFGAKLNSSVLFENLPVPIGIANSAFRVLTGCALEDDATDVYLHRINLPKYEAYCGREVTDRTADDEVWLAAQKYWEVFEMEAVRISNGDEFKADSNHMEKTDGVDVRDYHKFLKEPEAANEAGLKRLKTQRTVELVVQKRDLIQIGSPQFKFMRMHGTY